ncbi:MAG: hypothetical protein H6709_13350 [Kofleriaceae bacterium]|nr:hypothetical protein [Kofleriaceae bacterium]MCB9573064.1 hypothetical protein [Kofleriaceae bacterium]
MVASVHRPRRGTEDPGPLPTWVPGDPARRRGAPQPREVTRAGVGHGPCSWRRAMDLYDSLWEPLVVTLAGLALLLASL